MKFLLAFLLVVQVFGGLAGLGLFAVSVASSYYGIASIAGGSYDNEYAWYRLFLALYLCVFSAVIIMIEARWKRFMNEFPAFKKWYMRGLWYIFLAVVTLLSQFTNIPTDAEEMRLAIRICSYIVGGVGALYLIMDALCLRRTAKRQRKGEEGNDLV